MQTSSNGIKQHGFVLSAFRAIAVIFGLGALGSALAAAASDRLGAVAAPGPASLAEVLTAGLAGLAVLLVAGLLGSIVLATLSGLPGRLGRAAVWLDLQLTPRLLRHTSGILLGATLGTMSVPSAGLADRGPAVVAVQGATGPASAADPLGAPPGVVSGLPAPDPFTVERPLVRPQLAPDLLGGSRLAPPAGIVVHRGDTLWDIVGRALGPGASDLDIAREWPRWHEYNRSVIGDDPDLILPGQVLQRPAPEPMPTTHGSR